MRLAAIREGLAPRRLRTASRNQTPGQRKRCIRWSAETEADPEGRFHRAWAPKRAASSAREAGTPVAARRAKRADIQKPERCPERRRRPGRRRPAGSDDGLSPGARWRRFPEGSALREPSNRQRGGDRATVRSPGDRRPAMQEHQIAPRQSDRGGHSMRAKTLFVVGRSSCSSWCAPPASLAPREVTLRCYQPHIDPADFKGVANR